MGAIAGMGTTSGTRIVIGLWTSSPFGSFADAMVESADGHRVLIAPEPAIADYVAATYTFDEVRVEAVTTRRSPTSAFFGSHSLAVSFAIAHRTPLGWLLHLPPRRIMASPALARAADPVARRLLPGVRTVGSAVGGRSEFYGAFDRHRITALHGRFESTELGRLTAVWPPTRFGFSSTPSTPGLTRVTTTIERETRAR